MQILKSSTFYGRFFSFPDIFVYRSALRSGLISGSPKVIHPILAWILPRMSELKTRAYLAKYLMKVEVPQEIRADIEIEELYQQVTLSK